MSQNYKPINKNFTCKWIGHKWVKVDEHSWGEANYEKYKCIRCESTDSINKSSPHPNDRSLPVRW
jgi:hypothetical protein